MTTSITDHTDEHFKGQQATEEVVFVFRRHWMRLLPHTFIILGLFIFVNYFFYLSLQQEIIENEFVRRVTLFIVILVALYYLHSFFNKMLNYYLEIVIMTNYRLIDLHKTLFLHDDKGTIDLHEIQEIQKNQDGIFKNIFNYGEISIAIAGIPDRKIIECVPKPDKYYRDIIKGKRDYIMSRRQQKQKEEEKPFPPTA